MSDTAADLAAVVRIGLTWTPPKHQDAPRAALDALLARAEQAEREIVFKEQALANLRESGLALLAQRDAATARAEQAERERDEARKIADGMARAPYGEFDAMRARAESAEARVAELEEQANLLSRDNGIYLDRQREAERSRDEAWDKLGAESMRCERAEARVAELEAALRKIELWPFDVNSDAHIDLRQIKEFARTALAPAPKAWPESLTADGHRDPCRDRRDESGEPRTQSGYVTRSGQDAATPADTEGSGRD